MFFNKEDKIKESLNSVVQRPVLTPGGNTKLKKVGLKNNIVTFLYSEKIDIQEILKALQIDKDAVNQYNLEIIFLTLGEQWKKRILDIVLQRKDARLLCREGFVFHFNIQIENEIKPYSLTLEIKERDIELAEYSRFN